MPTSFDDVVGLDVPDGEYAVPVPVDVQDVGGRLRILPADDDVDGPAEIVLIDRLSETLHHCFLLRGFHREVKVLQAAHPPIDI